VRAGLIACASLLLVVGPTAALVAVGAATGRPYGQDGGVVQLPLAIDRILAGQSPYAADYSDSMLGKQSRASEFWESWGGNPILRHHAYLPGTHLLTLPFLAAGRALFGGFDARVVSLFFYALSVPFAVRLARGTPQRLCAAALVTLNPLVYWYQVFGANDGIFAALLLAAVVLAERGRGTLAGATLGLACATKQLAWPFAPFLLAQLSGARSLRELGARPALARLARPALAAALVFAAVVLPVAALDFRAFYADIVAYNVGLPGGDNYPLGGTPGFGFANFLLYFGAVTSLRDHFTFGVFYVVLLPLCLLLLRSQLRGGAAAGALVTGSSALLLVLYFSRVVHPNYLIAPALLLPLGVLACRRAADVALAPLLLLGLAVEIAEHQLFRAAWDEAVSLRLPQHLTGLAALVAPRGGPGLTLDPLGALLSALAAGLAVAYLVAGALGARPRRRAALVALAAALTVAAPGLLLARLGQRLGTVRTQDRWAIQQPADSARLARLESPYRPPYATRPVGREAWSSSFRLDPPRLFEPDRPLSPPGSAVLGALLTPFGLADGRWLSVPAYLLLLGLAAALVRPELRPSALAVAALSPFLATGTVFGAPHALVLATLAACLLALSRRRAAGASALAGMSAGLDHRAWLAAPLLALPTLERREWQRAGRWLLIGYAVSVVLPLLLDPAGLAASARGTSGVIGPGVGLANLLIFRGWQDAPWVHALYAVVPVGLAATTLLLLRRRWSQPLRLAGAAGVWLLSLFLAREASAEALGVPLLLLGVAALLDQES
jgi:hypothetical protein